jgi:hypothetical protein
VLPPGAEKECGTNVPLLPAEVPSGHVLKKQSGFVGLVMPPPLPAAGSTLPGKKKGPPPQKRRPEKTLFPIRPQTNAQNHSVLL